MVACLLRPKDTVRLVGGSGAAQTTTTYYIAQTIWNVSDCLHVILYKGHSRHNVTHDAPVGTYITILFLAA